MVKVYFLLCLLLITCSVPWSDLMLTTKTQVSLYIYIDFSGFNCLWLQQLLSSDFIALDKRVYR